jgi:hypothetical protein
MKTVTIVSGNFSKSGNNFTGYNNIGERIHIPMRQIENLGFTKESKIPFPLFAIVVDKEFDKLDTDGKKTGETFTRPQAGSIFKTSAEMVVAVNADSKIKADAEADLKIYEIERAVSLKAKATAAGLSEQTVEALLQIA